MKIMVEVDYTDYAELAIVRIMAEALPNNASDTVCLMMVVRNTPPPAATLWADSKGSLEHARLRIKHAALRRLGTLAEPLRLKGFLVETQVCESRRPLRILTEARRYRAHRVVIGTHSLTGIKRAALEALFEAMKNPDFGPQQDSTWKNQTAA